MTDQNNTSMSTETKSFEGPERRTVGDVDEYFNTQFESSPVYLKPSESLVAEDDSQMFIANVGAGVVVSLHDTGLKAGAMAYVLVPEELLQIFPHFEKADQALLQETTRPIDEAIAEMKKLGAGKTRIQARLMGGALMPDDTDDRGTKNYVFVREYVTRQGLSVLNEDLGGRYIRRVHYFPSSGRAVRIMLRRSSDFELIRNLEAGHTAG